jgi:hypothetical protein
MVFTTFHDSIIRNWNCGHTMACNAYRNRDLKTVIAVVEALTIRAGFFDNGERQAAVEKELELCIETRNVLAVELAT